MGLNYVHGMEIQTATNISRGRARIGRPRNFGAKFTDTDIAPDEVLVPEVSHDFDSERDRRPEMYRPVIEGHARIEEAKRQLKEDKLKNEAASQAASNTGADGDEPGSSTSCGATNKEGDELRPHGDSDDSDDSDDDDKHADKSDMPGTKVDSKQRITVRKTRRDICAIWT